MGANRGHRGEGARFCRSASTMRPADVRFAFEHGHELCWYLDLGDRHSGATPTSSIFEMNAIGEPSSPVISFGMIAERSEEHTSELQSLMRISYAVFCLKKKMLHSTNLDKMT